jgi:hypothetical protein
MENKKLQIDATLENTLSNVSEKLEIQINIIIDVQ